MAHRFRKYYHSSQNGFERPVFGLLVLYAIYLMFLWQSHNPQFYTWLGFGLLFAFILLVIIGAFRFVQSLKNTASDVASQTLVKTVKELGLDKDIENFINRFGMETNKHNWNYEGHGFDWYRLKHLRNELIKKGVKISADNWGDMLKILKYYIDQKQQKVTIESLSAGQMQFSSLSPSDFENLLYRLFQAMGYTVQKTGKTGDQGCDLITNKDGVRVLIQAKHYSSPVGNKAVQEAVAAQKFYDCTGAMVITSNSSFTNEAKALATANNVLLVGKQRLAELLLQYLKESWS